MTFKRRFQALAIAALGLLALLGPAQSAFGTGLKERRAAVTVPDGAQLSATATCSHGKTLVFGGVFGWFFPSNRGLFITEQQRVSKRSWRTSAFNDTFDGSASPLISVAYCTKDKLKLKTGTATRSVSSFTDNVSVTASCPRGKALSGGFRTDNGPASVSHVEVNGSYRSSSSSWTVRATNFGGAPGSLTAFVYCAKTKKPREGRETLQVLPTSIPEADADCFGNGRPKRELVGVGFLFDAFNAGPQPALFDAVQGNEALATVKIGNPGPAAASLTAIGYCLAGIR